MMLITVLSPRPFLMWTRQVRVTVTEVALNNKFEARKSKAVRDNLRAGGQLVRASMKVQ